uniref:PDZ domain-containing protein n=1 Tax=Guillardia theta TaxID=55529 RepID=A0A6U6BGS4_GUITH
MEASKIDIMFGLVPFDVQSCLKENLISSISSSSSVSIFSQTIGSSEGEYIKENLNDFASCQVDTPDAVSPCHDLTSDMWTCQETVEKLYEQIHPPLRHKNWLSESIFDQDNWLNTSLFSTCLEDSYKLASEPSKLSRGERTLHVAENFGIIFEQQNSSSGMKILKVAALRYREPAYLTGEINIGDELVRINSQEFPRETDSDIKSSINALNESEETELGFIRRFRAGVRYVSLEASKHARSSSSCSCSSSINDRHGDGSVMASLSCSDMEEKESDMSVTQEGHEDSELSVAPSVLASSCEDDALHLDELTGSPSPPMRPEVEESEALAVQRQVRECLVSLAFAFKCGQCSAGPWGKGQLFAVHLKVCSKCRNLICPGCFASNPCCAGCVSQEVPAISATTKAMIAVRSG